MLTKVVQPSSGSRMVVSRTYAIVFLISKSPGILVIQALYICPKEPSLFRLQPSAPAFNNTYEKLFWSGSFTLNDQSESIVFEQLESTFTTVVQSSQCRFDTSSKIEGLVLVKSSTNENVFFLKIAGTFSHLGMILKQENDKGLV